MRIEKIETITLRHPWGLADQGVTRDWTVVRVYADNGLVGIARSGQAKLIDEVFAPLLVGADPRCTAQLWQRMWDAVWNFGGPGRGAMATVGALDIALWDLYGKAIGEPVWRLLGGHSQQVPVYADGIGYAPQTVEQVAALVEKHVGLGFDAVKFHLSDPDPDEALEKARRSREVLGPERRLMIDIRRMWEGRLGATMARKFAPYDLFWIEEPVRDDDEPGYMRQVREASDALVAGGEGDPTPYGIRRLLVEGGLQVVQTDILIGGGFTGLMRLAALAEAHHAYIAPHGASFPELNCHLLAAVPNGLMVPACPHTEPYQIWSQLYDPAFEIVDGQIQMSERPGLGLEFNEAFIANYRV
tara:strand:- start:223 stop:1296 length:1074 start_codon:yes stop_codon:yes gene_type:complete